MTDPLSWREFTAMLATADVPRPSRRFSARAGDPLRFLSRPEVAERIGVKADSLNRYRLPPADAQIGARQIGWTEATIDAWHAARPSQQAARGHVR